jgi:hypothetical protein
LIAFCAIALAQPPKAKSNEIKVAAYHLDQVENPSEIERWRKVHGQSN